MASAASRRQKPLSFTLSGQIRKTRSAELAGMFAQAQAVPPSLERLAATPVLASEMPPGFSRAKVIRLAPNLQLSTLGGVRIDFINSHLTESESYALMKTNAAAARFAQSEMKIQGGSLFRVRAVAIGRFVIGATGRTAAEAATILRLAVAHFRRSGA